VPVATPSAVLPDTVRESSPNNARAPTPLPPLRILLLVASSSVPGPQSVPVAAPSTDFAPCDPTSSACSVAHDDLTRQRLVDPDSDARLTVLVSTSATHVSALASGPPVAPASALNLALGSSTSVDVALIPASTAP
jgi:hypothetical protein